MTLGIPIVRVYSCLLLSLLFLIVAVQAFLVAPSAIILPTKTNKLANHHQPSALKSSSSSLASTARTPTNNKKMRFLQGLSEIIDDYDVILIDMWGVLHDGNKPYDGVLEALRQLKRQHPEKRLIIVSNSSKRRDDSVQALTRLGFDVTDFDQVITSGELTHQMLQSGRLLPWNIDSTAQGQVALVLGSGDADADYCHGCGWTLGPVELASLILARGTFTISDGSDKVVDKRHDESRYEAVLQSTLAQAAQQKLPMLVANPDKVRPDPDRPPMPGKLGDMYEEALAAASLEKANTLGSLLDTTKLVKRIGKPFSEVYEAAIGFDVDRSRVIMIGDALETDMVGGAAANIATLWVLKTGIHGPDLRHGCLEEGAQEVLAAFNQRQDTYAKGQQIAPDYALAAFQW